MDADGVLGPQSAAALAAAQSTFGLAPTGALDPATVRSLLGLTS